MTRPAIRTPNQRIPKYLPKTLALLGVSVFLLTAPSPAQAVDDFEATRSSNAKIYLSVDLPIYQAGGRSFEAFWEQKGPDIHTYLNQPVSRAPVESAATRLRDMKEALDTRPSKELFAQWYDELFEEIARITRREISVGWDFRAEGTEKKIIELPELLKTKSWDDDEVKKTMRAFHDRAPEATALFFTIVKEAEDEILGRGEYTSLKQTLDLCKKYGVDREYRVKEQLAALEAVRVSPDQATVVPILGVGIIDGKLEEKIKDTSDQDFPIPSREEFEKWRQAVATRQVDLIKEKFKTEKNFQQSWLYLHKEMMQDKSYRTDYLRYPKTYLGIAFSVFLENYIPTVAQAEKNLFADPAYASLRDFAEALKSKILGIKFFDNPRLSQITWGKLKVVIEEENTRWLLEGLQRDYEQASDQYIKFAIEIWQPETFRIGGELLKLLGAACNKKVTLADGGEVKDAEGAPWFQGLQFKDQDMALVQYAGVLPEDFVTQVMRPFAAEVLIPTLQAS